MIEYYKNRNNKIIIIGLLYHYLTLFDRVEIITGRGINILDENAAKRQKKSCDNHKVEIAAKRQKKNREDRKIELAARHKKYREDHKVEIAAARHKKYRDNHKVEIAAKRQKKNREDRKAVTVNSDSVKRGFFG